MNWFRTNYDRVALLAGALFLLACSALIWRSAAAFNNTSAMAQTGGAPKPATPPAPALELQAAAEKLRQSPQWTFGGRSGLFVPEKHFIGPGGLPATLQTTEVHPPVPNEWLDQFGLPITEADVLNQDPDADGFTNLEEWQGRTNPTDKESRPAYVVKLKLRSFSEQPFRLLFSSWNPTTKTFEINAIDLKEPTQYLKVGQKLAGTRYKVAKFTEKHAVNPATSGDVDVSELLLESEDTKDTLTLVKEKIMTSPETVAKFVYLGRERIELTVKKDQEFSLPPEPTISYKLLEVQPDRAVLINMQKPEERIEIGLLAP